MKHPHFYELYLPELNQVLTVKINKIIPSYFSQGEGTSDHFKTDPNSSVLLNLPSGKLFYQSLTY